jgi:hypothetical protein
MNQYVSAEDLRRLWIVFVSGPILPNRANRCFAPKRKYALFAVLDGCVTTQQDEYSSVLIYSSVRVSIKSKLAAMKTFAYAAILLIHWFTALCGQYVYITNCTLHRAPCRRPATMYPPDNPHNLPKTLFTNRFSVKSD